MNKIFTALFLLITFSAFAQFTDFHPELQWYTIKGTHCIVHYHEGAERTAKTVAKIVDEIWGPITSLYEYEPTTVHFVIKDIDDYSNGATYFFDNKIEIWSSALDFELRGFHNWLRNVISHEFTHMVQIQASLKTSRTLPAFYLQWLNYEEDRRPDILYGFPNIIMSYPVAMINMPSWFAEGTAQYMRKDFGYDQWDSHRDMILRSYALDGNMLTWNQMGVFEKNSLGNESVYNSGFALARYIAQKYGEDKLEALTKSLGKFSHFTFDAACSDVLGISGSDLYHEWSVFLKNDYRERTKKVSDNFIAGEKLSDDGFGNFFPRFYGNDTIFYLSNKGNDYLSLTSLYMMDLKTKQAKLIQAGVRSTISQIPGTRSIIYARLTEENPGWANVHDLFLFDLDNEKETRLTRGLRADQPAVSPDGRSIVFTFQKDGTGNIGIVDIDGTNFRAVTTYTNGEQVFNPIFSPDGGSIVFDFAYLHGRDIASVKVDGSSFKFICKEEYDERNPIFDRTGRMIFSSDKTGIPNLYVLDPATREVTQLTNVLGGAFMPAVDDAGNIVYSGYTSSGYKLFYLRVSNQKQVQTNASYDLLVNPPLGADKPKGDIAKFPIEELRKYNDNILPDYKREKYSGAFTKLTFFPVLRFDNYNTSNGFFQKIKPGVYLMSTDMLNKYSIFGGATVNSRFERDLYFSFNYRNRLPLLFDLGITPELTLDLYSISRKTTNDLFIDPWKTRTDVTYDLFEVGLSAKHKIISRGNDITMRFSFSSYSATIGAFILDRSPVDPFFSPSFINRYLLATNFEIKFNHEEDVPYIDQDINPVGWNFELKYNYESNRYNPDDNYELSDDGSLQSLYTHYRFSRLELNTRFGFPIFEGHTLTAKLRAGAIFRPSIFNPDFYSPAAPDFFDFYLGGLVGMKSYPFYAVSGNKIVWFNLTYRFPLWKGIDASFAHLYIDKIFFSVNGDIGSAWNGSSNDTHFKKGVGAEIRFALQSFYIFPTDMFFNCSYGLDKFTAKARDKSDVIYGKELRYYAGILFGFDF